MVETADHWTRLFGLIRQAAFATATIAFATCVQAAATVTVNQRGLVFDQKAATVSKGDRLVFANGDDVIHNIHVFTAAGVDEKDLGLQKPGVPLTYMFGQTGNFVVRCNIHPSMKMQVTVK